MARRGTRAIDWETVKAEYANDPSLTYRKIAKRLGVHDRTVSNKAKLMKWGAARKKANKERAKKVAAKLQHKFETWEEEEHHLMREIQLTQLKAFHKVLKSDKADIRAADLVAISRRIEEITKNIRGEGSGSTPTESELDKLHHLRKLFVEELGTLDELRERQDAHRLSDED